MVNRTMNSELFEQIRTYVFLAESLVILAVNIPLVLYIILKRSNRQRKEFVMICSLAIADVIYALGFALTMTRRFGLGKLSEVPEDLLVPLSECSFRPGPSLLFIGNQALALVVLFNAIDRLIATIRPMKYYTYGIDFTIGLMSVPIILSIIIYVINLSTTWGSTEQVSYLCLIADIVHDAYSYLQMVIILISGLIYLLIFGLLRKKRSGAVLGLSVAQKKSFHKANLTIALTTVNAFTLLFIPDLLLTFEIGGRSSEWKMFLYVLILNKTLVNFVIYMCRHHELRRMLFGFMMKRPAGTSTAAPTQYPSVQMVRTISNNRTNSTKM